MKKNIVFIVIVVAVGVLAYLWYSSLSAPSDSQQPVPVVQTPDSGTGPSNSGSEPANYADVRSEILNNISTLKSIRLDISILDDPAFKALQQPTHIEPPPLQLGRANPFLSQVPVSTKK